MTSRLSAPSTKARHLRHLLVVALGQEEIGARVKQARDGMGLTQQEFAERIGLKNGANVSRIERGVDEVTPKRLRRISEASGRPMSFFVAEPEPTPNGQVSLQDLHQELAALHEDVRELLHRGQDSKEQKPQADQG